MGTLIGLKSILFLSKVRAMARYSSSPSEVPRERYLHSYQITKSKQLSRVIIYYLKY